MEKQEIEFVVVIADDDFSVPGGMVRKDEPFRCTRGKAKDLVGIKKAHYPTAEELEALADKPADADQEKPADADADADADQEKPADADADAEGDQEKLEAKRSETQATAEEAPAKAEAPKATKSTKASK